MGEQNSFIVNSVEAFSVSKNKFNCVTIARMDYLMHLIESAGYFSYIILFVIVFLESFPPTFFLPGDSLLFTTGFLASQGYFELSFLIGTFFLASIFGYMFSYAMGKKLRNFVLHSNDRYWFKTKHLEYTEKFFNKYDTMAIVLGRFVVAVRSFGPTLAGAVKMDYQEFMKYNILGAFLWTGSITSIGYYLGQLIPNAHLYLTPVILVIIFASLLPGIIEFTRSRIESKKVQ